MSLRNVESTQSEMPIEQTENVQRAIPVFPVYSSIIIVCLIIVYFFQFRADGNGSIIAGGDNSILLAGFDKPAFLHGQYWRIFTGFTLHGGLMHLFFNSYGIYILGKLVETLSNRAHLANIFLLAAVGGNILSLIFLPDGISVGASGGVTGFLGYLAVYGYKRKAILSNDFLKNMLFNIGFLALYGIVLYQKIDNFGHLGGLLAGAFYGFIQIPGDVYKDPRNVSSKIKLTGSIALGVTIVISIFSALVLSKVI